MNEGGHVVRWEGVKEWAKGDSRDRNLANGR